MEFSNVKNLCVLSLAISVLLTASPSWARKIKWDKKLSAACVSPVPTTKGAVQGAVSRLYGINWVSEDLSTFKTPEVTTSQLEESPAKTAMTVLIRGQKSPFEICVKTPEASRQPSSVLKKKKAASLFEPMSGRGLSEAALREITAELQDSP